MKASLAAAALIVLAFAVAAPSARAERMRTGDDRQCADTPNAEPAIAACTRLYENESLGARNRAIALGNRGAALKLLGRYDEAIADFALAIELDPKNPQYYCQRGDVRMRNKEYEEAIADYTTALKKVPDFTWAYHGRGQIYLAQGKSELALDDFNKALRARPGEFNLLVFRGRANLQQKLFEAAVADFSKALASPKAKGRLPKERAAVMSLRAFALLKQGRAEEATPDAEEGVKLAPKNSFGLSVMGLIEEQRGRNAEAKDLFTRALAIEPKLDVAEQGLERLNRTAAVTGTVPETAAPPKTAPESKSPSAAAPESKAPSAPSSAEPAYKPPVRESVPPTSASAVDDLCARYIPTVGQTVLVACDE
jgi:tetratricopeptide (TPR) repeat protein